jgi:hypothetical protein
MEDDFDMKAMRSMIKEVYVDVYIYMGKSVDIYLCIYEYVYMYIVWKMISI